mgnify:CR=1 FL=1
MTQSEIDNFYLICFKSEKWKKWVNDDFDILDKYSDGDIKLMWVDGKEKDKKPYTKQGFIDMAIKEDGCNGILKVKKEEKMSY